MLASLAFRPVLSFAKRLGPLLLRAGARLSRLDVADAMVVLMITVGAVTWTYGIAHSPFDYDEWVHAHEAWLVSNGLRPFRDFFECHPPFAWYPLSLFFRVFGDSYDLIYLFRVLTGIGHLAFLVALFKNIGLSLRELPEHARLSVRATILCVAAILIHGVVMDYMVEFRLDSWPNAFLMIAIYRYRLRRTDAMRASIELAAISTAAFLCSPKLVVFAGVFVATSLAVDDRRLVRLAGMLAGGVGVLALGAGFLVLAGHNPVDVYRLALGYHQVLNDKGGFGHGNAEIVWDQTVIRNVLIASVIAWPLLARRRIYRFGFEITTLLFLVLQLKLVHFGYKQYYSAWFMVAVAFVPYLEVLARRVKPLRSLLLAAAVFYGITNAVTTYHIYQENGSFLAADIAGRKEIEAMVPRGHFVMASIEAGPLFRRSSVYQHHNSYAPSGYDGTRVMLELNIQPYSGEFTVQKALAELEARPPDLIVSAARFPDYVRAALDLYFAKHQGEYTTKNGHYGAYRLRKR